MTWAYGILGGSALGAYYGDSWMEICLGGALGTPIGQRGLHHAGRATWYTARSATQLSFRAATSPVAGAAVRGGGKLLGRVGSRLLPGLGWALLAYDVYDAGAAVVTGDRERENYLNQMSRLIFDPPNSDASMYQHLARHFDVNMK